MVDLCKEWESKYSHRIDDIKREQQTELMNLKYACDKKLQEVTRAHDDEMREKEQEFQKNMDLFEEEFKKVLLEQNQKYKDLQMAFKDKGRTESDIKNLFKVTIAKNNEQEDLIQELTETLELAKD